jgi:hypothetical protein
VAVLGGRVWVACGGTMQGQRFTEDRGLWSWCEAEGWRCVAVALPFAVRNVHMTVLRDRLLFHCADGERIVLRTLLPDASVRAPESAMQH